MKKTSKNKQKEINFALDRCMTLEADVVERFDALTEESELADCQLELALCSTSLFTVHTHVSSLLHYLTDEELSTFMCYVSNLEMVKFNLCKLIDLKE